MVEFDPKALALTEKAHVARLATVDPQSRPHVVPVVFVFHEGSFFVPLDEKTKRVSPSELRRVKNIENNPNVTLLIDEYHDDWKKLCYLLIHGTAGIIGPASDKLVELVHKLLVSKYPQYQEISLGDFCIKMEPQRYTFWQNSA